MKKTFIILGILGLLTCLGLSTWDQIKKSAEKSQAQTELTERQRSAKVDLAYDAISTLESKINSIQKRTGETKLCRFVLMGQDEATPEILKYRLSKCFVSFGGENYDAVLLDTIRAIKSMVKLDGVTARNPEGSTSEILDQYEEQWRLTKPSDSDKECEEIVGKIKTGLQAIEAMPSK